MWLWSSDKYKQLIQEEKDEICNGTGAAGTPKSITKLLDSLYGFGFSYRPASNIHDFDYNEGINWKDKLKADFRYLVNCMIIFLFNLIKTIIFILTIKLNLLRALLYPATVLLFGWRAFYKNK